MVVIYEVRVNLEMKNELLSLCVQHKNKEYEWKTLFLTGRRRIPADDD